VNACLQKAESKTLRAILQTLVFPADQRGVPPPALLGGTGRESSAGTNVQPPPASLGAQSNARLHLISWPWCVPSSDALIWELSCTHHLFHSQTPPTLSCHGHLFFSHCRFREGR